MNFIFDEGVLDGHVVVDKDSGNVFINRNTYGSLILALNGLGEKPEFIFGFNCENLKTIHSEDLEPGEPRMLTISELKKMLKHCKNPLERKKLEQELAAAYKNRKDKRRSDIL